MAAPLSGTVTVATAGTAVAFPSNAKRVIALKIRAAEGNTGDCFIGNVDVSSSDGWVLQEGTDAVHSEVDWPIPAGHTIKLADMYADAANNGDKVYFIATLE